MQLVFFGHFRVYERHKICQVTDSSCGNWSVSKIFKSLYNHPKIGVKVIYVLCAGGDLSEILQVV